MPRSRLLALVVLAVLIVFGAAVALVASGVVTPFHDDYHGGYIEAEVSPDVPANATPVAVDGSSVERSDRLLTALQCDDPNSAQNVGLPTQKAADTALDTLPERAHSGAHYYLRCNGTVYRVQVIVLL